MLNNVEFTARNPSLEQKRDQREICDKWAFLAISPQLPERRKFRDTEHPHALDSSGSAPRSKRGNVRIEVPGSVAVT